MKSTAFVHQRFLELEDEHDLFDLMVDGIYPWERVRFDVNRRVMQNMGLIAGAEDNSQWSVSSYLNRAMSLGRAATTNNPFMANRADFVFWGLPRRKQLDDGMWWDIYCDPIYQNLQLDYLHLEEPYLGTHRTPAKTERIDYLDAVTLAGNLAARTRRPRIDLGRMAYSTLEQFESSIQSAFGVSVPVREIVREELRVRKITKPLYSRILARTRPTAAVLVKSYGKETFVEVCKEQHVPTVELQHGALGEFHYGYSYPGDRSKHTFPDYLLTFGNHFSDLAEFPIPECRVLSVGYPFLESALEDRAHKSSKRTVVFLSQGTIGRELSKLAATLSSFDELEYEVIYKLHPMERNRWRRDYPWLREANLTVVVGDNPSLYELFSQATAQVGVYSTALYEGLAFGLATYLLDTNRIEFVSDLVEKGWAKVVKSAPQLAAELSKSAEPHVDATSIFEPNALDNLQEYLTDVSGRYPGR